MKLLRKYLHLFLIICMTLSLTGCTVVVDEFAEERNALLEETEDTETSVEDDEEGASETEAEEARESEEQESPANSAEEAVSEEKDAQTEAESEEMLLEDGSYTSKEEVALYLYQYGHLPSNFITKKEAEKLGWEGGSLEPYAPGMCIGGSHFGNYEGLLPEKEGRTYTECDIDTLGADKRGAKRIVFSNDGLIYYTEDHYESFELLYGEES